MSRVRAMPFVGTFFRSIAIASLSATMSACAARRAPEVPQSAPLEGTDSALHTLVPREPYAYSVVIFFSAECHVLAAHDQRVRELAAEFAPKNVQFLGVDSEISATLDRDRAEVVRRGYPFPIVLDPGAAIARSLGAEFAGYTVVIDREGRVRYRGGIDSDRVRLQSDATPYVRDALSDLTAGRAPRVPEGKALGCALRRR
jgi:peroxiredoxin